MQDQNGPQDEELDLDLDIDTSDFVTDGATGSKLSGEQVRERVAGVVDFFQLLRKAFKQIGLYRHNVTGYGKYLAGAYEALHRLLESYEGIAMHVEQRGFKYLGQPVYSEEATDLNLAFMFYRDGVRLLVFRQGLTALELLDFALICLTNFKDLEFAQEDMGSLMWKSNFSHIEHVVLECFALGSEAPEQT
jgi:hypothetical protein